ncbi:hypothetical protein HOD75_00445 [archaeon]|jgi:hypothetical protein|nr:hypothetical protein [archaeon]MBT4241344.1 hypothetical protein [archaeon]MBT4418165.1 hypothetical protein [archaeon]
MSQIETNLTKSFDKVKKDIIALQNQIIELAQKQDDMMRVMLETRERKTTVKKKTKKKKTSKKKK